MRKLGYKVQDRPDLVENSKKKTRVAVEADHRTLSAARKNQRTRARILEATMRISAEFGSKPMSVNDILDVANISRSSFYAHFPSLSMAMEALGEYMATDLDAGLTHYQHLEQPVLRITVPFQAALIRASIEPSWGSMFASYIGLAAKAFEWVRRDLVRGREQGVFRFDDADAAVDVHFGGLIHAATKIQTIKKNRQRTYIEEVAKIDLQALGVPEMRAREAVYWASKDLKDSSVWPTLTALQSSSTRPVHVKRQPSSRRSGEGARPRKTSSVPR